MTIKSPCIITPRLMAGVQVGSSFVSIGYAKRAGDGSRTRYQYHIDPKGRRSHSSDDIQSGMQGGNLQEGLESLLSFLLAFAESTFGGENFDLFPARLHTWANAHFDEISMLALELEETPDAIVE
jgi:hypothetical protein